VSAPQAVPPLAAVVMAAGAGRRMGHRPKALLRRDGEPLVVRTVRLLREAGVAQVAVVLGHHATQVQAALAQSEALARLGGWRCATNPDPDAGPGSSLRAGLEALQDAPGAVLVALADHPLLEAQDLTWLRERWAKRAADHHLLVPVRAGQPGHPLILDEALRREVLAMPADEGVREWRRRHPDQVWSASVEHERFHADVDEEVRLLELEARHGVALQWPDEWGRASGGDPGG